MRTEIRLALLLTMVTAGFALSAWGLYLSDTRKTRLLTDDIRRERTELMDKLLVLTGQPLEFFVHDYSMWDDMASFVRSRDPAWAKVNIRDAETSLGIDAAWVFQTDLAPVYVANRLDKEALNTLPIPAAELAALVAASPFPHFFIDTPAGLFEVQGAPIQPSSDIARATPPQGWLFGARIWNDASLRTLANLTASRVSLTTGPTDTEIRADTPDTISIHRELKDWRGRPLRTLHSHFDPPMVAILKRQGQVEFWFVVGFSAIIVGCLYLGIRRWVSRPLHLLATSLRRRDAAPLAGLRADRAEFGQLARLTGSHFIEHAALQREIAERSRVETALRESELRYRTLFENAQIGIYRMTPEGRILEANPAAVAMLGYDSFAELAADNTTEGKIFPTHPHGRFRELMERDGEVRGLESEWNRTDGTTILVRENARAGRDERGKIVCYEGTIEDITDRRRAEAAVRASDARLQHLLTASPVVLFTMRIEDGRPIPIWGSDSIAQFGYTPKEAQIPGWWFENVHPDDLPAIQQKGAAMFKQGRVENEYRFRCKNGEYRWVRDVLVPTGPSAGGDVIGTWVDITELKRAEAEQQRLFALLNSIADIVLINDVATLRIIYANEAAVKQLGYTHEELLAMTPLRLDIASNLDKTQVANAEFARGVRSSLVLNTHYRRKDGRLLPVEVHIQYYAPAEGSAVCLAVARDTTERQADEQRRLRAQRLESIGTLAGGVAHDLNNVFTPLMMFVDELRSSRTAPDSELVDMVETNVKRGAGMVRQLLTFSHGIEGSRLLLQPHHLLKEVSKTISGTFPKSIQIETLLDKDSWPISGDAAQLHQVLLNLCFNARDAMPEGGTLKLTAHNLEIAGANAATWPEAHPGRYSLIEVIDTGTGIPPNIMSRIFDPFLTTKGPDKGTGLALSSALGIVRSHGGTIQVTSEVGHGSAFRVLLPASPVEARDDSASPAENYDGRDRLVLVVDDEATIRSTTTKALTRMGFRVVEAGDGHSALAQCARHKHDLQLIITDLHMPEMNGLALVRSLRLAGASVKIVAMSGRFEDRLKSDLAALDVRILLGKPFTRQQFVAALRTALG